MKFNFAFASIILALIFVAPAVAGPFEDAVTARESRDDVTALRLFRPLAEKGDARAQYYLSLIIGRADAASNGSSEAFGWAKKAAAQGLSFAQYHVAVMYDGGVGTPQDAVEGAIWLRKAADQGNAEAQHALGIAYDQGRGVPQDYAVAHMWFNLAAARSHPAAAEYRNKVGERMSSAQLAEAQKMAREWKSTKQSRRWPASNSWSDTADPALRHQAPVLAGSGKQ